MPERKLMVVWAGNWLVEMLLSGVLLYICICMYVCVCERERERVQWVGETQIYPLDSVSLDSNTHGNGNLSHDEEQRENEKLSPQHHAGNPSPVMSSFGFSLSERVV